MSSSSSGSHSPPDIAMTVDNSMAFPGVSDMYIVDDKTQTPAGNIAGTDNSNIPKPKRLACMICRKRKLKCDGQKPKCSTCTRLNHPCAYDEVRRKSGPKRGYVKALEERLKQVETLLKTQDHSPTDVSTTAPPVPSINTAAARGSGVGAAAAANFNITDPSINIAKSADKDRWHYKPESPPQPGSIDEFNFNSNMTINMNGVGNNFTWEMIGLGLEEPLPPQETIDELHQIYFEKINPSMPIIHRYRYLAAMDLAANKRPPVCLRYAMWTLACSVVDKYNDLKDLFYQRSRKYLEADYMKGFGEQIICVGHAQTHILLASYELKMMYFPRAWQSTGSAVRLAQMTGLHRLDGAGLDVKQCLPPPRDWTEREERRRTFWMAFAEDRYASIGTGWPMTVDEKDIMTNLPASDEAFDMSRPEETMTLAEAMTPAGARRLNSFGGIVLMACLFGRNLIHLHRPDEDDNDHDMNGEFWKRHRAMDNILLNTSLGLPAYLKLPAGLQNPNVVYTNMCIHTSTICLHQAAIFKADKNRLPASVSSESKVRCITAANEIASIMRMVSHLDLSSMNPFLSFCLYVSSRVFVQYLKSRPEDSQSADSLRFLLAAMNALKRKNPLTESFLVQLDVDLEALTARIPKLKGAFMRSGESPIPGSMVSGVVRSGATCEEGAGNKGIFTYRNECHFLRTVEDGGNPTEGPDVADTDANHNLHGDAGAGSWLTADQNTSRRERGSGPSSSSGMPGMSLTPNSQATFDASSFGDGGGAGGDNGLGDSNTSPNAGSNQPTPNSTSNSSDQYQQQRHSGRGSYDASPVLQDGSRVAAAIFGGPAAQTNYGVLSSGMPIMTGGDGFAVASDWGLHHATAAQTPVGQVSALTPGTDGVLRSLMQMGPMETMDLGWETNP